MNELQIFNYSENQVRTVLKDGQPYFVAVDVCGVLNLSNTSESIKGLDDDEKSTLRITEGGPEANIITESGLYSLIIRSNKPEAKKFKKWITAEVLPTIRKTGGYVSNDEMFVATYLPFADDTTKTMFRSTLETVRKQNELILKQQKEIEYKEDVIINLIDEVELSEKRQVLNRVVRHNGANFQERWKELYRQFEMKYHIDINKRMKSYNESHKPKMKNKLDYLDKVMDKVPELYEIACKLYENDVKELTKQMYQINEAV